MLNYSSLTNLKKSGELAFKKLSRIVSDNLKPKPGLYAFFNHITQALERLEDCDCLVKRLFKSSQDIKSLIDSNRDTYDEIFSNKQTISDEAKNIMKKESLFNRYMKLDMESLYLYGGMLLDQWALLALYISGVKRPEKNYKHPFHNLINEFEKGKLILLTSIWTNHRAIMLWLDYQIRFFRNRFIVHSDRPWQRGTTRSVHGVEFKLFIPSPPGWLDDKKIDSEIKKIIHLAPEYTQNAPDDYWGKSRPRALIEIIFNNIGNIEKKEDRQKIASIFSRKGGSTPSFQVIAEKLFTFVKHSTSLLIEIAIQNIKTVNLGRPYRT